MKNIITKQVATALVATLIISITVITVAGSYVAYVSFTPNVVLRRTLGTAEIKSCTLHKIEPQLHKTQIMTNFEISNPTLLPVTIKDIEATLLLNGTNYNSTALPPTNLPRPTRTINPGETKDFSRLIQIQDSPISNTPTTRHTFNITMKLKITGETTLLFLTEQETDALTHNQQLTINTG